jgi:hypothetical protein
MSESRARREAGQNRSGTSATSPSRSAPGVIPSDCDSVRELRTSPWTPPELALRLVRVRASGPADRLSGRSIQAEHDDIEDLIRRADQPREPDLDAIHLPANPHVGLSGYAQRHEQRGASRSKPMPP